jgi:predicted RNA-binding protein YlxR (DUF448 family)
LKKKPERTCVGCGGKRPKSELYRLALSSEGQLVVDGSKRRAGRGAYLCGKNCWAAALKRKGFSRAFRGKVSPGDNPLEGLEAALIALQRD